MPHHTPHHPPIVSSNNSNSNTNNNSNSGVGGSCNRLVSSRFLTYLPSPLRSYQQLVGVGDDASSRAWRGLLRTFVRRHRTIWFGRTSLDRWGRKHMLPNSLFVTFVTFVYFPKEVFFLFFIKLFFFPSTGTITQYPSRSSSKYAKTYLKTSSITHCDAGL